MAELPSAGGGAVEVQSHPVLKNKPEDTAFKQQRIASWQPVMSPVCAIGTLGAVGVLFIIVGAIIIVSSDNVQMVSLRYDQEQNCDFEQRSIPGVNTQRTDLLNSSSGSQYWACTAVTIRFTIPKVMRHPVYMYYQIDNMNQNHRSYARSQNVLQLAGQSIAAGDASDCSPLLHTNEFSSIKGSPIVELLNSDSTITIANAASAMYNPCGLIAWSMFNDSFVLRNELSNASSVICETSNYMADGTPTGPSGSCTKNGVAWSSDPGVRFNPAVSVPGSVLTASGWNINPSNATATGYDEGWGYYMSRGWYIGEAGHRLPDPLDEDLMVWMRLALLADFRKLFRVINVDLQPGTYSFLVFQRFDVRPFGGKKTIVLTTNNWLGGQNYWLGGLYLAVGCVCSVISIAFLVKHITTPQLLSF